ncbi:carbamoyltransferase [Myxococcota bacterium]
MKVLGVSAFYHDSAAALLEDGVIIAAAQEERFTRKKHDASFPTHAVRYCLAEGDVAGDGLDGVVFYDKPLLKFHRILETYFAVAPRGLSSFVHALPLWLREKLWIEPRIRDSLEACGMQVPENILYPEHHICHAASAFYPSPYEDAAILTIDGVGEWATATIGVGEGNTLRLLEELAFPHSLGLLYSAFTYFTGFRVNSGEYKLMGLAPYGSGRYTQRILDELIDLRPDGSFRMNMDFFGYLHRKTMTNDAFATLFGGPARKPETPITEREMDLARSIQEVTEEIVLRMARHAREVSNKSRLCMAGGVALNCVANGRLLREGIFDDIWIQPAAGDAGGAVGAAFAGWHLAMGKPRTVQSPDGMNGAYLGPEFSDELTEQFLSEHGYPHTRLEAEEWPEHLARLVASDNVIGLFQGRMEFGPRALGNRSIIGDPRSPKMQSVMNLKIKYRESFRPFAPSCLEERVSDFFELDRPSPYMLLVAPVVASRCTEAPADTARTNDLRTWVNEVRSDVPAITHVDNSARVQTVSATTNPRYHQLITAFEELTGYGIVINTSFNVRGEPIVCTPEDAYRCFMRTEMDYLVLGSFLLNKRDQPDWHDRDKWQETFTLD